jgi:hypothetical protein
MNHFQQLLKEFSLNSSMDLMIANLTDDLLDLKRLLDNTPNISDKITLEAIIFNLEKLIKFLQVKDDCFKSNLIRDVWSVI